MMLHSALVTVLLFNAVAVGDVLLKRLSVYDSAAEFYDFRLCPHTEWSIRSKRVREANLMSVQNSSDVESWSCGRSRGLKLGAKNSTEYLSTDDLGASWTELLASNETHQLSIHLWFSPDLESLDEEQDKDNTPNLYPILTWRSSDKNTPQQQQSGEGCPGYELQVSLFLGHLLIRYQDGDAALSCRVLYLRQVDLKASTPFIMLAISFKVRQTLVWVNDQSVHTLENSFTENPLLHWSTGQLQVFGSPKSQTRFGGSVHELAFFDKVFSNYEIQELFRDTLLAFETNATPFSVQAHFEAIEVGPIIPPRNLTLRQGERNPSQVELFFPETARHQKTLLQFGYEIVKLPAHGQILISTNERYMSTHERIVPFFPNVFPNASYAIQDDDFFNFPKINALGEPLSTPFETEECFVYQLVLMDDDGFVAATWTAEPVVQNFLVQHVNHQPTLLETPVECKSQGSESNRNPAEFVCQDISVFDEQDYDLNLIRVDVWAEFGRLTLNPDNRGLADFVTCQSRTESSWQCFGTGSADRHMTFLAVPSHLVLILKDLVYAGFSPGTEDMVQVVVFDGEGGDCLSSREHEEHTRIMNDIGHQPFIGVTSFNGCYRLEASITVPETSELLDIGTDDDDESGIWGIPNSDLRQFDLADLFFWILLTIFLCSIFICCVRVFRSVIRFMRARGGGVALEDASCGSYSREKDYFYGFQRGASKNGDESVSVDNISNRVVVFVTSTQGSTNSGEDNVVESSERDYYSQSELEDNSSLTEGSRGQISV